MKPTTHLLDNHSLARGRRQRNLRLSRRRTLGLDQLGPFPEPERDINERLLATANTGRGRLTSVARFLAQRFVGRLPS